MKIFLIVLFAVSTLLQILSIGKERKPATPEVVAFGVIINLSVIVGIIYYL